MSYEMFSVSLHSLYALVSHLLVVNLFIVRGVIVIEKATSKLLLEPDWDTTLQICDSIRQGDVQPVYVLAGIRKKVENENPHVAKFALQVNFRTDSINLHY